MLHVSHSVCEMKNTKKLAVFFWAILQYSQSGDDLQEDFKAKFWLQPKYEKKIKKNPSIFLATYSNHVYKSRVFPYDFGQILTIENLKKHMILDLLIFSYSILAIYIAGRKQKAGNW